MQHGITHADAEQFCRSFRYEYKIRLYPLLVSNVSPTPFSYDAHPMSILTSAFAYLGSYYNEANPSLQGDMLFTGSWAVPDCRRPCCKARISSRKAIKHHSPSWTSRYTGLSARLPLLLRMYDLYPSDKFDIHTIP